jgi:DNA-binding transcriptional MocR family regulator
VSATKQYPIRARGAAELVRAIEDRVASGALVPGQALPSVRRLGIEVGLSPVTVATALAELRRRGVVVTEPRRATRIGPGPPLAATRAPMPVPPGARDLSLGNPDPELLPDLRAALARCQLPVRLYGQPPALGELLELARQQLRADGLPAEQLCLTSGAMDAIERVLAAHLRPGDRVAVENPGYAALYDLLRAHGLVLDPVEVDDHGMLPDQLDDALERGALAAVITPRGQNPTGAALDRPRARELGAVLERFPHTLLVEDDHLGPIAGTPLHTLVAHCQRWASTRSVAKALGPDLRLAVLAGDHATIARVQGRQQCGPGWVSHILQELVLSLWSDPHVHQLVQRAADTYRERRQSLLSCLARHRIDAHGASGLNVWIPVSEEAATITALVQRHWVLAPGAPYRLAGAAPAVRVTTSTLAPHEAEQLAQALAQVLAPGQLSRSG